MGRVTVQNLDDKQSGVAVDDPMACGRLLALTSGPAFSFGFADPASPLANGGDYLTQPAAMVNLESPERRFVLRVSPNLEGLVLRDGELTFGGWGEGFLDARHPHTLVHEAMVSLNFWDTSLGSFALSGGRDSRRTGPTIASGRSRSAPASSSAGDRCGWDRTGCWIS